MDELSPLIAARRDAARFDTVALYLQPLDGAPAPQLLSPCSVERGPAASPHYTPPK